MMNRLYCIYDRGIGAFRAPVVLPNDVMLRRLLQDAADSQAGLPVAQQADLYKYSDQFEVYCVGTFDDVTGAVAPVTPGELILRLSELSSK